MAVPLGQVVTVLTLNELTGNTVIVALPVGASTHVFVGILLSEKLDIVYTVVVVGETLIVATLPTKFSELILYEFPSLNVTEYGIAPSPINSIFK